jgi:hypothetical protein
MVGMLPILALAALILGLVLTGISVTREPWKEFARACIWVGLLVCLFSLASWHAIPMR